MRLAIVAPDLTKGLRAAIATVVPFYLAIALRRPELAWVALGGWLGSLADPGGSRHARAFAMACFVAFGGVAVVVADASSRTPLVATALVASISFLASFAGVLGSTSGIVGTLVAVTSAIAATTNDGHALRDGLLFAGGALWAVALSSIMWPVWPHRPARYAVARVFAELAEYAETTANLANDPESRAAAWSASARTHQRAVRAAIEQATTTMLALRARRSGESTVGANLRLLLGDASSQFFRLIALAEEVEASRLRREVVPALTELASAYRAIRAQLLTLRPAAPRELPTASTVPLAHRLLEASREALEVSRDLEVDADRSPDIEHGLPSSGAGQPSTHSRRASQLVHSATLELRDALSWRSPILRHAVRVAGAAAAAMMIAHAVSPVHGQWVTVTTIAVLQPQLGSTFVRVIERVVGTVLGGVLAVIVISMLRSPLALAAIMFPLSIAAVVTRPRSYRLFVVFLTPLFLLVADHGHPGTSTAIIRIADVALGGAIALVAAIVIPSWERRHLPDALATALDAIAHYVQLAYEVFERGRDRRMLPAARREVGIALEDAEASLERMLTEPRPLRRGASEAMFLVTYVRRLSATLTAMDEAPAASHSAPHAGFSREVRDYLLSVIEAAKSFIKTQRPTPSSESPRHDDGDHPSRLVHHAELIGQLATEGRRPRAVSFAM
ncbi:MAG: putative rane protein [Myxococcales bacterium]|nr:putative rane protein [Myxococcales bacterium]